jgi:hypothetical protein
MPDRVGWRAAGQGAAKQELFDRAGAAGAAKQEGEAWEDRGWGGDLLLLRPAEPPHALRVLAAAEPALEYRPVFLLAHVVHLAEPVGRHDQMIR